MKKIGEYSDYFLRDVSIGQKIRIICLALVIIPVLVLGAIAYSSAYDAMFSDIKINLEGQVADMQEASATVYNLTQSKVNSDLNLLHLSFYQKGEPDIVNGNLVLGSGYIVNNNFEIVDEVQKIVGGTATIFQKKGDKAIRVSTNVIGEDGKRAVGTPVSDAVYDVVINQGKTYYGTANVVGKQYITAYEPMKNRKGEIIGILYVGVEEDKTIGVLKDQIKRKVIGEQGYMYVLNSAGKTVIHPINEDQDDSDLPFVKEILNKKNGFIRYNYNGVDKVAAFTYFDKFDWIIVAGAALSDFTGPIDAIRNTIIVVIILGIIGGIAVSSWFSNSITRQMKSLLEISRNVTAGNLSVNAQAFTGKDEIGLLGKAFSDVIDTFERFSDEIQRISKAATEGNLDVRGDPGKFQGDYAAIIQGVNNTIQAMAEPVKEAMQLSARYAKGDFSARMNQDLSVSGEFIEFRNALNTIGSDVSRSIAEVNARMNELVDAVEAVDANVESVTGGIRQANQSIRDVSEGTGQVAHIAGAVSSLAEHSGENTRQILNAMQDLATTVSSVAGKMNEVTALTGTASQLSSRGKEVAAKAESGMKGILQSSSEIESLVNDISYQMGEIGRIVDIIGSIAEQTNLLALNAAIEAARAGEAGLGFAVVAGEVKDLATGSQKSAENIASIINTLQKKTETIAGAVNVSLTEVKTGNEAVTETLDIFNKIVESVADIDKNMNDVAAASEEQAASVEEVAASVHEFGDMVSQTAKESIGLAAASEESSAAVDQIVTMIHEVDSSMDQIRQQTTHARESAGIIGEEMKKFII